MDPKVSVPLPLNMLGTAKALRADAGPSGGSLDDQTLTDYRLRRGTFRSVPHLIEAITTWVGHGNTEPKPLVWHAAAEDKSPEDAKDCHKSHRRRTTRNLNPHVRGLNPKNRRRQGSVRLTRQPPGRRPLRHGHRPATSLRDWRGRDGGRRFGRRSRRQ
jgi:hypothetical protein